ncbi:RES family NAD+ phosphorylase [Bradyrhizobium diazoefficiens]
MFGSLTENSEERGLDASDSASEKYVCFRCIDDPVLKKEITTNCPVRRCTYCKRRLGRAVALETLADRIETVYLDLVEMGEDYLVPDDDSDNAHWRTDGSTPSELIAEMIEADDSEIADDVVSILSEKNAYDVVKDGATDYFDSTSDIYVLRVRDDPTVREIWNSFCRTIKHDGRFFNDEAAKLLAELLDPVLKGEWPRNSTAIKTITPTDDNRFLFRGRLANDLSARKAIYRSPIRQLSAPPRHLNTAGRMNAAGITNFYASFDKDTCVAELRTAVGGQVVIGKFEIIRPVRVFDLTVLETASSNLSYFEDGFGLLHAYSRFLQGFHAEIKRPILPGQEPLEYLPTQFVGEYLWRRVEPRLDGMIYGSSQLTDGANNIVLFPHASDVEGYENETEAELADSMGSEKDEEVVWLKSPPKQGNQESSGAATLRYLGDGLTVSRVRSISYETDERHVWFSAMPSGDTDDIFPIVVRDPQGKIKID